MHLTNGREPQSEGIRQVGVVLIPSLGNFNWQDISQGRVAVGVRHELRPGDHQQPSASFLYKVSNPLQVFFPKLGMSGIDIAEYDQVELSE